MIIPQYEIGLQISTTDGDIKGHIIMIEITGEVRYQMGYFHNGEYKTAWLYPYQFNVISNKHYGQE
jgi:hypothetical protein